MKCQVIDLGRGVPFQQAWDLQNDLAARIAVGQHDPVLLLLEHSHVYTFGRQGQPGNLLWDEAQLAQRDIQVHWIDRGGDVTYHGPGQLVGYPLLPLGRGKMSVDPDSGKDRLPQMDYVGYIRDLEKALIKTLFHYGVASAQITGQTGVWVQPDVLSRCVHCPPEIKQAPAKIASIGVKVDARGVSRHGFALNVNPDMSYWGGILACGLNNQNKVSLANLVQPLPTMQAVKDRVTAMFGAVFGMEMMSVDFQFEPVAGIKSDTIKPDGFYS
jgi:lipoate-protein ligase B